MQEQQKVLEAWIGVGLVLVAIGVFLLFNKSQQEVTSPNTVNNDLSQDSGLVYKSSILQDRAEKLESIKNQPDFEQLQKQIDENIAKDVEAKTAYTPANNKPFFITNNTSEQLYKEQYSAVFGEATSSGMGLELVYFISQMSPESGEVLPLSPQDIESIYRVATEYELFADNIQKLATPPNLAQVGEITSNKAREIAFYLRRMMDEKDPFVYSVYFSKYVEAASYILKINKGSNKQLSELEQIRVLASSTETLLKR